jgi:hypothetical protein
MTRGAKLPRAWVVILAVAVIGAVALTLSPELRRQWTLSTTHEHAAFVELYFTDEGVARGCSTGRTQISISLRSHLDDRATVAWAAELDGAKQVDSGAFLTQPGQVSQAVVDFAAPKGNYRLAVTLPGRSEHLQVICDRAAL